MALKPVQKEMSLSDKAYLVIRDAIIIGDFAAGDVLTEEKLSSELSISRTPLRTALGRLMAEGLLTSSKGRSMTVTSINTEDAVKISRVRQRIETLCISELDGRITANLIARLRACIEEQRGVRMEGAADYMQYIQLDYQFHTTLARATENQYLADVAERINMHSTRCLMLSTTLEKSAKLAVDEHEKIVNFLEKGDLEGANAAMIAHILGVEVRLNGPETPNTSKSEEEKPQIY